MKKLETITLSSTDKISFISNLSTMVHAGLPIFEIVSSLYDDAKGNTKIILRELRDDLTQGKQLYLTFRKFPLVFDKVAVNVIKASEEAGTLDQTLADLKKTTQEETEFTDKVKSALVYPLFIVIVFLAVFLVILTFVVPKIATVFARLRSDLPLPTKILIFLSTAVVRYSWAILGGVSIVTVLGIFLFRRYRLAILNMFYSLPLISQLVHEIDITRFSRSMYLLLYSGIPITSALELASDVLMQKKMRNLMLQARDMIMGGKKLSEGLRFVKGLVPMLMIKLVEAGESTGSLDKSMADISEYFDYQVTKTLKTITVLIEPVMLVLVGIVIGGMMVAIVSPIYGLIGKIGNR